MSCLALDCDEPVAERGACLHHRAIYDRVAAALKRPEPRASAKKPPKITVRQVEPRKPAPVEAVELLSRFVWAADHAITRDELVHEFDLTVTTVGRITKVAKQRGHITDGYQGFRPGPTPPPGMAPRPEPAPPPVKRHKSPADLPQQIAAEITARGLVTRAELRALWPDLSVSTITRGIRKAIDGGCVEPDGRLRLRPAARSNAGPVLQ
jgi:hypothetical protein